MMFKRATIIGLGLIGASLGLALKERRLAKELVGVSRRRSTIQRAKALGIVDRSTLDLKKAVKDSDFIILAVPVLKIIDIAASMSRYLKKGAIVTDVGSTKQVIVKKIERVLPDGVDFVGGHPLAGSERSGAVNADKDLFKGAYCILTKTPRTNIKALNKLRRFWNKLGMKVEIMSPGRHDKVVSALSHLPHALSIALSNVSGKQDLHLAAGGFRDTTRIALSSPELWKDIFVTNSKNVIRDIGLLKKELSRIERALRYNRGAELLRLSRMAKRIRNGI